MFSQKWSGSSPYCATKELLYAQEFGKPPYAFRMNASMNGPMVKASAPVSVSEEEGIRNHDPHIAVQTPRRAVGASSPT